MSTRHLIAGIVLAALGSLIAADALAASPERPPARWRENYFPNVELTTHEGKSVRFYDDVIKDRVVAINFFFTSCKDVCPGETARMRQVQQLLGDRVGDDVFMYSITIDPETDTPEEMAAYHKRFKLGPGWTFLTGKEEDLDLLQRKLGLLIEDLEDPNDHNVNLIIGNEATGQWMTRSPYDNPNVLAKLLANNLHNWKRPFGKEHQGYEVAKEIPNFSKGQFLFQSRCNACHTIGQGEGVGPDLIGVAERREPKWLSRWLKEPDSMIAEGDPIALQILEQYGDLRMPNLSLNDTDVSSVIEYLKSETVAVREKTAAEAIRPVVGEDDPHAAHRGHSAKKGHDAHAHH